MYSATSLRMGMEAARSRWNVVQGYPYDAGGARFRRAMGNALSEPATQTRYLKKP